MFDKATSIRNKTGGTFLPMPRKWKIFMAINRLLSIPMYCDCDHFEGNVGIQNIFTRTRYQEVLQKFHFAKNTKQNKTDKGYKIKPIIYHLNELFQTVFSNEPEQSIDEYLAKSKGRSSIRQYLKMKPIKWVFKWWFWSAISSGYLYEFYLYLSRKKVVEVNLGESVVMQLSEKLKGTYCTLFLTIFLTGQHWSINFLTMELTP